MGYEAIHEALTHNRLDVARALLDAGVPVNEWGVAERTPLCTAVEAGNTAAVDLLLERGADLTIADGDGGTALDAAYWLGDWAMVERLLDAGARLDDVGACLSACAENNALPCLPRALDALPRRLGRPLTPEELTPALALAPWRGGVDVVRLLLAAGAPAGGLQQPRPLYTAAVGLRPDVVRILLEAGADPEAALEGTGVPAAAVWLLAGRADMARAALARLPAGDRWQRFDTVATPVPGFPWLTLAAMSGSRECLELAWERGAYANKQAVQTAFGQLCNRGRADALPLVLSVAAAHSVALPGDLLGHVCASGSKDLGLVSSLVAVGCSLTVKPSWATMSPAAAAARQGAAPGVLEALFAHGARLDGRYELARETTWQRVSGAVSDLVGATAWFNGPTVLEAAVLSDKAEVIACVLRHTPPSDVSAAPPAGWHDVPSADAIGVLAAAFPALARAVATAEPAAGQTGLQRAAARALPSAAEGWLAAGADPLQANAAGLRALHMVGGDDSSYGGASWAANARRCGALLVRAEAWARRRWAVAASALDLTAWGRGVGGGRPAGGCGEAESSTRGR
jgi:hypothetical protein